MREKISFFLFFFLIGFLESTSTLFIFALFFFSGTGKRINGLIGMTMWRDKIRGLVLPVLEATRRSYHAESHRVSLVREFLRPFIDFWSRLCGREFISVRVSSDRYCADSRHVISTRDCGLSNRDIECSREERSSGLWFDEPRAINIRSSYVYYSVAIIQ